MSSDPRMNEWEPDRWWRVVFVDPLGKQHVWYETSDELEARGALPYCPGGEGVLQRSWRRREHEWRAED